MKKLIILIALLVGSISFANAQNSDHFTFKGIPINGSVSNFGNQLVADGFTKIATNTYRGKFLRNDSVVTLVSDDNNMVWRVAAVMAHTNTWNTLEESFNNYVNLYSEKYGTPTTISKKLTTYTGDHSRTRTSATTGLEMGALDDGECQYYAIWNLPQGSIEVRIVRGNEYYTDYRGWVVGCIRVEYTDNVNKDKVHQSDLDEI